MKKKLFLTLCLSLFLGFNLSATDYYVSSSGNNSNDGLTSGSAFLTISAAHSVAISGDTIYIDGSVAHSALLTITKALTFIGINSGTITGTSNGIFQNTTGEALSFQDLVFTGVTGKTSNHGGAFRAVNAVGALTFTNCDFTSNSVVNAKKGGAIYVKGAGSLTINNCDFTSNSAHNGGGAVIVDSASTTTLFISNSTFTSNDTTTGFNGGAVLNSGDGNITVTNSLFMGGNAKNGGAIHFTGLGELTITNSTFVNNTASSKGGAIAMASKTGDVNITNTTIYNNNFSLAYATGGGGIRLDGARTVNITNSLIYGNTYNGGLSDIMSSATPVLNVNNCLIGTANSSTYLANTTPVVVTDSKFEADLTNSNLAFVTPNVTFSAPINLTDDTPIDYGNDNNDIGSWDSKINIFEATTDTFWGEATNWSNGAIPLATDNVAIVSGSGTVNIKADVAAVATDLSVNAAATLQIKKGGSLIVSGTATGNVTYRRKYQYVDGLVKGWYLTASPVAGQDYNDTFISSQDIAENNTNNGIATYVSLNNTWDYHEDTESGTFASGKGYAIKVDDNAGADTEQEIAFTGTINTNDAGVNVSLSTDTDRINLLGNPYTSYISSAIFLANAALSETQTMWIYDQKSGTNGAYEVKTLGDDFILAPGQGFFVTANAAGGTVNFAEANQIDNGNTDTFQKSSKTEVKLQIAVDGYTNFAKIYYLENATKGFDLGYEGEVFKGSLDSFGVYTQLLFNDKGNKYQVQSLPNTEFESNIISVGVKAAAGKEITFSAETLNLPSGINVYLEDRLTNTFTRLDEANSIYKVTLIEALNDIGRFYLHTKASVLSVDNLELDTVNIYKTNNATLRVTGLTKGKASLKLFNILGKQVLKTSFTSNGVSDVALPSLATGIYVVQLSTENGKLSKKITLE